MNLKAWNAKKGKWEDFYDAKALQVELHQEVVERKLEGHQLELLKDTIHLAFAWRTDAIEKTIKIHKFGHLGSIKIPYFPSKEELLEFNKRFDIWEIHVRKPYVQIYFDVI